MVRAIKVFNLTTHNRLKNVAIILGDGFGLQDAVGLLMASDKSGKVAVTQEKALP